MKYKTTIDNKYNKKYLSLSILFLTNTGFSFTNTDNSQSGWEGRIILIPPPFLRVHERSDIFLVLHLRRLSRIINRASFYYQTVTQ